MQLILLTFFEFIHFSHIVQRVSEKVCSRIFKKFEIDHPLMRMI